MRSLFFVCTAMSLVVSTWLPVFASKPSLYPSKMLRQIQIHLHQGHALLKRRSFAKASHQLSQAEQLWRTLIRKNLSVQFLQRTDVIQMRQKLSSFRQKLFSAKVEHRLYLRRRCPVPDEKYELLRSSLRPLLQRLGQDLQVTTTLNVYRWRIVQVPLQQYEREQRRTTESIQVQACIRQQYRDKQQKCSLVRLRYRRHSVAAHWTLWRLTALELSVPMPCKNLL